MTLEKINKPNTETPNIDSIIPETPLQKETPKPVSVIQARDSI